MASPDFATWLRGECRSPNQQSRKDLLANSSAASTPREWPAAADGGRSDGAERPCRGSDESLPADRSRAATIHERERFRQPQWPSPLSRPVHFQPISLVGRALAASLDVALTWEELKHVYEKLPYSPFDRFMVEVGDEKAGLEGFLARDELCNPCVREWFQEQRNTKVWVVAVSSARRRWQALGVWNTDWAMPSSGPPETPPEWQWPWIPRDVEPSVLAADRMALLDARGNLPRDKLEPGRPHSRPDKNTTFIQGEVFLITRPWFTYAHEMTDWVVRFARLHPPSNEPTNNSIAQDQVRKKWQESLRWFGGGTLNLDRKQDFGWNWPHEGPSPKPLDFTVLNNVEYSDSDPESISGEEECRARRQVADALELIGPERAELLRMPIASPRPGPDARHPMASPRRAVSSPLFLSTWNTEPHTPSAQVVPSPSSNANLAPPGPPRFWRADAQSSASHFEPSSPASPTPAVRPRRDTGPSGRHCDASASSPRSLTGKSIAVATAPRSPSNASDSPYQASTDSREPSPRLQRPKRPILRRKESEEKDGESSRPRLIRRSPRNAASRGNAQEAVAKSEQGTSMAVGSGRGGSAPMTARQRRSAIRATKSQGVAREKGRAAARSKVAIAAGRPIEGV